MNRIFKSKKIILILLLMFSLGSFLILQNKKPEKINIEKSLKSESYSYLPIEAKNYVKEVYQQTGEIILTEKNKKDNKPYLNPQYVKYLSLSDEEKKVEEIIPISMVVDYINNVENIIESLPSSYDLRNVDGKNYITPIRNQGNLNICWAFSAAETAESYLLKKNDQSYSSTSTIFSERQLDYATSNNSINDYNSEYQAFVDRNLGGGGNFYVATGALANGISLTDSNNFKPYNDNDFSKMELHQVLNYNNSLYEVNETVNMPILDPTVTGTNRENYINTIKNYIVEYGGLYVGTGAPTYGCSYYDNSLNNYVIDVDDNCTLEGHAMQIIGWDDNTEYSYCADNLSTHTSAILCNNKVSGQGVWILKNSWGSGSSSDYPYLAYDSDNSAISLITDMTMSSEKEWDNNYILGNPMSEYMYTNKSYNLNTDRQEKIDKIKFISDTSNASYNIKITKDGTLVNKTFNVTNIYPGLITIDLSKENINYQKSIKIEITGTTNNYFLEPLYLFTENTDLNESIELQDYNYMNNLSTNDNNDLQFRYYSKTNNIASGTTITYKFYNNNKDVSSLISYSNNVVAENNINTLLTISKNTEKGNYIIRAFDGTKEVGSANVNIYFDIKSISGLGTQESPYLITTANELYMINENTTAYYKLMNDIDLTELVKEDGVFYNSGLGWSPIANFNGNLDGNGYSIIGLYINRPQSSFITNLSDATISNLKFVDANIVGSDFGGILAININSNSHISSIGFIDSQIKSNYVGILSYKIIGQNINVSNVFSNSKLIAGISFGGLSETISSTASPGVLIKNIELIGEYEKLNNATGGAIANTANASNTLNISNILLLPKNDIAFSSLLFNEFTKSSSYGSVSNLYYNLFSSKSIVKTGTISLTNVQSKTITELKNSNNYMNWPEFSNNWKIETIDSIERIPILKFVDFEYTNMSNIALEKGHTLNLYDIITPNNELAKNITYEVNDTSIVTIDSNGIISALKPGSTTIHIFSLYDGYEKDILINVSIPNYTVKYNPNSGIGIMNDQNINYDQTVSLTPNLFIKDGYKFIGWNTELNGTGTNYTDGQSVLNLSDVHEAIITLYAQWQILKLSSNDYNIDTNYVKNLNVNTTFNTYKIKFENYDKLDIRLYNKNNERLPDDSFVGTGTVTKIYDNDTVIDTKTNVVLGDPSGDGKINYLDYVNVYNHIYKMKHSESTKKLLINEYLLAADMSKDGKVNYLDYVSIYNKIKELKGGTN